jgi:hypothetical protein
MSDLCIRATWLFEAIVLAMLSQSGLKLHAKGSIVVNPSISKELEPSANCEEVDLLATAMVDALAASLSTWKVSGRSTTKSVECFGTFGEHIRPIGRYVNFSGSGLRAEIISVRAIMTLHILTFRMGFRSKAVTFPFPSFRFVGDQSVIET